MKRLFDVVGGKDYVEIVTKFGLIGHPDCVLLGIPYEVKTSRSWKREIKVRATSQLRYYMAGLGSLEGVLVVIWQVKSKRRPIAIEGFRLKMDKDELQATYDEAEFRTMILRRGKLESNPVLGYPVKWDKALDYECGWCKWRNECDTIDERKRKDPPTQAEYYAGVLA